MEQLRTFAKRMRVNPSTLRRWRLDDVGLRISNTIAALVLMLDEKMALRQDEWPRSGVTICRRDVGLARFELATLDPQIERATIDPQIGGCARPSP